MKKSSLKTTTIKRIENLFNALDKGDFVNAEIEFYNLELKMIDLKYLIREEERKQDF